MWGSSNLKKLRWSAVILGVSNVLIIIVGFTLTAVAYPNCIYGDILPFLVIVLVSCVRIAAMIRTAVAQRATAMLILGSPSETLVVDALIRHERRIRYKRWLWWTRFAMLITVLQVLGATYLLFSVSFQGQTSNKCLLGLFSYDNKWQLNVLAFFIIIVWFVVLVQCFTGYDVIRWRSFYSTHNDAWKNHYREVFDHGIREALCCLGRVKYLTVLEEDEVCSVAQLLGDLVAYRATGTGHLEFLTGLALLQRQSEYSNPHEETIDAPEEHIQWASVLHPFAEAAYTGLLLDFGRNPVLFICSWLYRQGILTPWTRKRLPTLRGDNWWRGHAAAFLKYVNLPAEVLRHGRVNQAKCEAAYFIVVLHNLKSVVIAVRGTETPEDLITDGLCKACILTTEDLYGLINGNHIPPGSPYHGHSGIAEAARDLFTQIEGNLDSDGSFSESGGLLSSLLGAGCECEGYNLQIVGHSLGGAIAAMLGLRLYSRYPKLHVYTFGPLPCVDLVVANACSEFVTSIIYNNEFSARLSVASLLRLQASAMMALSEVDGADSVTIAKLAYRFLSRSILLQNKPKEELPDSESSSKGNTSEHTSHCIHGSELINDSKYAIAGNKEQDQEFPLWQGVDSEESSDDDDCNESLHGFTNPFAVSSAIVNSFVDPVSQFMGAVPSSEEVSSGKFPEMFIPGLLIHIIPQKRSFDTPLWKRWRTEYSYKAYVANREAFKDIIVSPSMFIDHLPWRCRYALDKILEMRKLQAILNESDMV